MHIIFQLVMIKNNLFVPCALVSFMQLHRLETHDNRGYLHDILGHFCILKGAYHSLPFFITTYYDFSILKRIHINPPSLLLYDDDILGHFCILKGAYHSLPFSHTQ
jgi:hypothetical protein